VQDRGVLDVGALADGDDVAVAADDGLEPDARPVVQDHGPTTVALCAMNHSSPVEYDFALPSENIAMVRPIISEAARRVRRLLSSRAS